MLDWITVRGLRAIGHHGVYADEKANGQEFVVDLKMGLPIDATSDELSRTVDYSVVSADVVAIIQGEPVDLIETLAGRIAERCLAEELVQVVQVSVHKPSAPMQLDFTDVCVDITRSKP